MDLQILPVRDSAQLDAFVDLPFRIYEPGCPWVGPLRRDNLRLLTPGRHPFWQNARRELFLALRDGRPAGRIAAIVDDKYNDYSGQLCGAFGFFECADRDSGGCGNLAGQADTAAGHALLSAAKDWLEEQGMKFMRGPLNPSMNYACGALVSGFDLPPALLMPWNPPTYPRIFETWRMFKEQDLFAYTIERAGLELPEWIEQEIARAKADGNFSLHVPTRRSLADDIRAILDIYAESWAENWGFSPLSPGEADEIVHELKGIMDPDFFVLFHCRGEAAGGMVALPDINPLLRRLRGRLGLSAPWHYFRSRGEMRSSYRIMLLGIRPRFRLMGLPLLLLDHILKIARRRPELAFMEGSWVLEDNMPICDLIEDFGGRLTKRYRIYRRDIRPC